MSYRRSPQNDNPLLIAAATILNLGNYSATSGSFTAAIGPMMWMSVSPIMVRAAPSWPIHWHLRLPLSKETLAPRINIDAKLAALGKARQIVATGFQAKETRYRGAFRAT
jgi:hypothetical protein